MLPPLANQRGIFMRELVHLGDRIADLVDAARLFTARARDLGDDVSDLLDRDGELRESRTAFADELRAGLDLGDAVLDQVLDFSCRRGAAPGQIADLAGDDRKATTQLAGPSRLDCGVQSQQIGLKRDLVNDADDIGDLF